ncbi:MAG: YifB family Mg chelatase-like AAA ATPase [Gammaproteobacteria bacterium]
MSVATIFSRAQHGLQAPLVRVEVYISKGMPGFAIVGLPETAIKESRDRIRSALLNAQFEMPIKKIVVNLSPADLPKEGARFDLPIAIGILAASDQLRHQDLAQYEFAGELALSGELRPIDGMLPFAIATQKAGRSLICPVANTIEALLGDGKVYPAQHLLDVVCHLQGMSSIKQAEPVPFPENPNWTIDISDIQGQAAAKRALLIAASGGHSMLMSGPPGSGKSMLAQRLPTLLPPLTQSQALEIAAIYSISRQGFKVAHFKERPFRSPHHTSSPVSLVGGGSIPQPGEISLAHHGVLFLDELPEFSRKVIEVLREPIENKKIHIARANGSVEFPAQFQMICAMNPCPCGYLTDPENPCRCTPANIERYQGQISGPIMDRIDIHIEVPRVSVKTLIQYSEKDPVNSAMVRDTVVNTQAIQYARSGVLNAHLSSAAVKDCALTDEAKKKLEQLVDTFHFSARAFYRIIKVARTIADLEPSEFIDVKHITESAQYRPQR